MKNFRQLDYDARIGRLLSCENSEVSIASVPVENISLTLEGIPGDTHSGITRPACERFPYLYEEKAEIKNSRQLSIVSSEELALIAGEMEIDHILAEWLGANLEVSGIPDLTLLPPSSRLLFPSKAVVVIDIENRPCIYPAQIIDEHFPGKGRKFVRKAMSRRGVTAWVEREGIISTGDSFEVHVPDQKLHPSQIV